MTTGSATRARALPRHLALLLGLPAALAALLLAVPGLVPPLVVIAAVLAAATVAYVVLDLSPALLFSLAVVLQSFSGNWVQMGLPIGLDRVLFAAALVALARRAWSGGLDVRLRWRAVHSILVLVAVIALCSALWGGTLFSVFGVFALLDRLGLVPFAAFFLAPLLYRTARERNTLLVAMVALGAYLGTTALLEGLGLRELVLPRYIDDPAVGLHYERARGPFTEAVAFGLGLFHCAVAAAIAVRLWRSSVARATAAVVGLLCLTGTLFTVTRAVWLACLVATVLVMAVVPRLRPYLLPALAAGAAFVVLALATVPGFAETVGERTGDNRSIWDRYNTNAAAARIVLEEPLRGVGWQRFAEGGVPYLRQSADYPITGVGIEVHNVFLSHAAELGLPGAALYLLALTLAVGGGLLRRTSPELTPWRVGLLAVSASWFVVASFGPLSYALPNTLLWLWAGLVLAPVLTSPRTQQPALQVTA